MIIRSDFNPFILYLSDILIGISSAQHSRDITRGYQHIRSLFLEQFYC